MSNVSGASTALHPVMSTAVVVVEGRGLHGGQHARVELRATNDGCVALFVNGTRGSLPGAAVRDVFRSTTLAVGAASLRTVEHLAAALFGLGVTRGFSVTVEGDELPLACGGASEWVRALARVRDASLGDRAAGNVARVARSARVTDGDATYLFEPAADTRITARVELGDARYDREASWDGSRAAFERDVAPARTFAREEDLAELAARGVASWVPPESVVVLCKERPALFSGRAFSDDEPARHKLQDLIGDLYVRCGVLRGHVHATRPGHARTHAVLTRALADGVIELEK